MRLKAFRVSRDNCLNGRLELKYERILGMHCLNKLCQILPGFEFVMVRHCQLRIGESSLGILSFRSDIHDRLRVACLGCLQQLFGLLLVLLHSCSKWQRCDFHYNPSGIMFC